MKQILITFLFLCMSSSVHAEKFLVNDDGGVIVITAEPAEEEYCRQMNAENNEVFYYAFATESSGKIHHGCWNRTAAAPGISESVGVTLDFSYDISREEGKAVIYMANIAMWRFVDLLPEIEEDREEVVLGQFMDIEEGDLSLLD